MRTDRVLSEVRTDRSMLFRLTSGFKWVTEINFLCQAFVCISVRIPDCLVNIRTGRSRIRTPPPTRGKGFISYHNIQTGSGGPPILLLSGYFGFFPGVRRPGRQASPCLPSSTRVKNEWSYTPLPLYVPWRGKGHLFRNFFGPLTTWNRVLPQNEARWSSFRLETFHVLWYPC